VTRLPDQATSSSSTTGKGAQAGPPPTCPHDHARTVLKPRRPYVCRGEDTHIARLARAVWPLRVGTSRASHLLHIAGYVLARRGCGCVVLSASSLDATAATEFRALTGSCPHGRARTPCLNRAMRTSRRIRSLRSPSTMGRSFPGRSRLIPCREAARCQRCGRVTTAGSALSRFISERRRIRRPRSRPRSPRAVHRRP
jgi:hypothetical protein